MHRLQSWTCWLEREFRLWEEETARIGFGEKGGKGRCYDYLA